MVYAKLLLTAFVWGGTFVAGRLVGDGMGAFSAAFLRFVTASVCMLWLMRIKDGGLPSLDTKGWIGVALLGLTGVFAYNACFFAGLQSVPAGRAAVIVACNPIAIALLATLFFKEELSRVKCLGILLSVSGAITVISRGDPVDLFTHAVSAGDILIFGCVASWSSYSLLGKKMMQGLSAHAAVAFSCITGTIMLFPFALHEGLLSALPNYTLTHLASILYLGILGTVVGFTWFYEGVKEIGASKAGVFINIVPITAILCGWLFLGENIAPSLLGGGILVAIGVYLANRG